MKVSNIHGTQPHTTHHTNCSHTTHVLFLFKNNTHIEPQLTPSRPHPQASRPQPQASRPQLMDHIVTHRNSLHASRLTILVFTHTSERQAAPMQTQARSSILSRRRSLQSLQTVIGFVAPDWICCYRICCSYASCL